MNSRTLIIVLILGLSFLFVVFTAEIVYHVRRAVQVRSEWKGRLWLGALMQIAFFPGVVLLLIFGLIPQLEKWNFFLCGFVIIIGVGAVIHRTMMLRILRASSLQYLRQHPTRPGQDEDSYPDT